LAVVGGGVLLQFLAHLIYALYTPPFNRH
jgi:hypothetical protein